LRCEKNKRGYNIEKPAKDRPFEARFCHSRLGVIEIALLMVHAQWQENSVKVAEVKKVFIFLLPYPTENNDNYRLGSLIGNLCKPGSQTFRKIVQQSPYL
jgi:hypothetical protein